MKYNINKIKRILNEYPYSENDYSDFKDFRIEFDDLLDMIDYYKIIKENFFTNASIDYIVDKISIYTFPGNKIYGGLHGQYEHDKDWLLKHKYTIYNV